MKKNIPVVFQYFALSLSWFSFLLPLLKFEVRPTTGEVTLKPNAPCPVKTIIGTFGKLECEIEFSMKLISKDLKGRFEEAFP